MVRQKRFNQSHSKTRLPVERAIGKVTFTSSSPELNLFLTIVLKIIFSLAISVKRNQKPPIFYMNSRFDFFALAIK